MSEPYLTIGIPTFNRADAVSSRIAELLSAGLPDDVGVLVIDNHSTDDTVERLGREVPDERVRVLSNESNLGYGGNFLRLFRECRSAYLLVVSDEDRVEVSELHHLIAFLRERTPGFVSPRASVHGNESYRGSSRIEPVAPERFKEASFYVSGLTFSVERTAADAAELEAQLATNSAVAIYPQVLLSALAVGRSDAMYFDRILTTHMEHRPTSIVELTGGIYNRVTGRWAQALGFEAFFEERIAAAAAQVAARYRVMRDQVRGELYSTLMVAMRRESPALADAVRAAVSPRARVRQAITALRRRTRR